MKREKEREKKERKKERTEIEREREREREECSMTFKALNNDDYYLYSRSEICVRASLRVIQSLSCSCVVRHV